MHLPVLLVIPLPPSSFSPLTHCSAVTIDLRVVVQAPEFVLFSIWLVYRRINMASAWEVLVIVKWELATDHCLVRFLASDDMFHVHAIIPRETMTQHGLSSNDLEHWRLYSRHNLREQDTETVMIVDCEFRTHTYEGAPSWGDILVERLGHAQVRPNNPIQQLRFPDPGISTVSAPFIKHKRCSLFST